MKREEVYDRARELSVSKRLAFISHQLSEGAQTLDEAHADLHRLLLQGQPTIETGIRWDRADELELRPVEWLWHGWIPRGKLTMLAGDACLGKSLAALDVASRLASGRDWPDGTPGPPRGVTGILAAEDDAEDTIGPRLAAAYAELDRVHILRDVQGDDGPRTLSLASDVQRLSEDVQRLGLELLIIDPITAYQGGADSNSSAELRPILHALKMMAEATRCAVLVMSHHAKAGGQKALHRILGSVAYGAAVRSAITVAPDPEDEGVMCWAQAKASLSRSQRTLRYRIQDSEQPVAGQTRPVIAWLAGTSDRTADDLMKRQEDDEERSALRDAMEWLEPRLPILATDAVKLARAEGIAERTLHRARAKLGIRPRLQIGTRKSIWDRSEPGSDV